MDGEEKSFVGLAFAYLAQGKLCFFMVAALGLTFFPAHFIVFSVENVLNIWNCYSNTGNFEHEL